MEEKSGDWIAFRMVNANHVHDFLTFGPSGGGRERHSG
jgi:hypothetical protein